MIEINWRSVGRSAAVLVTLLSFIVIAQAQRGGKGGGNTNPYGAIASFTYCAQSDFVCENANRVRMDINAPYVDGQDGVDAKFNVGVSGDLTIEMGSRQVVYDLRNVINFGNPQPDWWYSDPIQTVTAHINVGNAWAAKEQCGAAPVCDEIYLTRMNGGGWDTGRQTPNNRLQWNPFSEQPFINTPAETSWVEVHYSKNADDEFWVVTPLPNAGGYYLAGLQSESRKTVTASGQYNMPFRLEIRLK